MEKEIYEERRSSGRFRRRFGLAFVLLAFGICAFGAFLYHDHGRPKAPELVVVKEAHLCPHLECKNPHDRLEPRADYSALLLGLLFVYLGAVGIGAFAVEIPR